MTPEQVLALLHEEDRERAARVIERNRRAALAQRNLCLGPNGECRSWYDENRCAACPKHGAKSSTPQADR